MDFLHITHDTVVTFIFEDLVINDLLSGRALLHKLVHCWHV